MYDVSRDVDELLNEPIPQHYNEAAVSYEPELSDVENAARDDIIAAHSENHNFFQWLRSFCKRFYNIIAIIASAIVVICMLFVIFSNSLLPYFNLIDFKSPRERFIAAETDYANDIADSLTAAYGTYYSQLTCGSVGYDAELHVLLSDQLTDMINECLPEEKRTDLSGIDDIAVSMDMKRDGFLLNTSFTSMLKDHTLFSSNTAVDLWNNTLFCQFPELSNEYLAVDLDLANSSDFSQSRRNFDSYSQLTAALPSEQVLNQVIRKYFSLIINQVQNVEKSEFTFCAGDMELECSRLTATITEKELIDMSILLLQTMKSDDLVLGICEDVSSVSLGDEKFGRQKLINELDRYIWELRNAAEKAKDENYIQWIIYIDQNKNLIGRRICVPRMEDDYFSYMIFDGNTLVYYFDYFGVVRVEGKGKRTDRTLNANFDIYTDQTHIAQLSVEEFEVLRYVEGNISAKFTLRPSLQLTREMLGDNFSSQVKIVADVKTTNQSAKYHINVYNDNNFFAGFTLEAFEKSGDHVELPDSYFHLSDESEFDAWLETVDFDRLKSTLMDANIPPEFADVLTAYLNQF